MKNTKIIQLIAILVILIIGCLYYLQNRAENDIIKSNSQMNDSKIYTNNEYGFEFNHPISWKVVNVSGNPDYIHTITKITSGEFSPGNMDYADIRVLNVELGITKPDARVREFEGSRVTINNISWLINEDKGDGTKDLEYITGHGGKTFYVNGSAHVIDSILSTFKFLK